jgi:hypothetical protein
VIGGVCQAVETAAGVGAVFLLALLPGIVVGVAVEKIRRAVAR